MYRPKEKTFIYGVRAVQEAINSGKQLDKILIQSGIKGAIIGELRGSAKRANIPTQNVPINKLNFLTQKNHQGVIAFLSPVEFQEIESIIPSLFEAGTTPLILALDRVTDIRNFGAICRSAECAGVHAIVISAKGAAAINADAVKSSAGALLRVPICRTKSLINTLFFLQESGLNIASCTEKADEIIYKGNLDIPLAIVMGSEDKGISREVLEMSDQRLKIPLQGEVESLNVSVASGIILFEALRQREVNA